MKDIIKKILFEVTRAKSFLLNNINQNGLLDSINRVGSYDKLRKILSNENFLTPDVMIKFISDVIDDTGYLTFFDLDLEPIIIKRTRTENHQIEGFSKFYCTVSIIDKTNDYSESGEYSLNYLNLDPIHLYEITDGLIEYFEKRK